MIDLEAIWADNRERDAPNPNIDILIAEVEWLRTSIGVLKAQLRELPELRKAR